MNSLFEIQKKGDTQMKWLDLLIKCLRLVAIIIWIIKILNSS